MARKFKIKKGDQVVVITGRDKGKKAKCSRFCVLSHGYGYKV